MFKERYYFHKKALLEDPKVNPNNRKTIKKFLEYEEYKLKRKEGLSEVDERSYKTLHGYVGRLKHLNDWFKNRDWKTLKKPDIKKLIDDLEDGIIKTRKGTRYADRSLYYQMLQGKLFDIVKKSHLVREYFSDFEIKGRDDSKNQVKFIDEETFRQIVDCAIAPEHRCLLWLAFDIGENIGSLLELEKDDFKRQVNEDTKEPEYLVILSKEKLKRSRTPRSEINNYPETVKYLDIVLKNVKPAEKRISNKYMKNKKLSEIHGDDKLFKFGMKASAFFLERAAEKANVRCMPEGQKVTWKVLRSSMSCDLLKKEWSRDEVNARLGHKPSSRIIDRYINFLALDRKKPKKKVYESNMRKIEEDLERTKELNKLQTQRLANQKSEIDRVKEFLVRFAKKEIVYDTEDDTFYEDDTLYEKKKPIVSKKLIKIK